MYNAHTVHHVFLPSLNKCSQEGGHVSLHSPMHDPKTYLMQRYNTCIYSVLLQEHKPEIAMLCTLHPIDMKLARKDASNPAPQRRTSCAVQI